MSRLISGKAAVSVLVAIFVMVCLTSSALAQVPADAVLAMHFDEGSGTIVKDESGYENDGTIHGATWTSGISGKALSFDGADDYVEIPHKNSLDISNEITIGVWIRIASATSGIILEKDVIGTGLNDWTLGIGEGKPYFIVGVNYKNYNLKSPIPVDDNNWHYIAVRRDFNGLLQLDVDGVEVASENFPKGSISNSESIHIGCWDTPRGIESFFEGTVDELYIYNQALSDEEIEALYKGLITPTPTPTPIPTPTPAITPTPTSPCVYYEEDFETNTGYTSSAPEYAYWDSEQGNYYVKTYDNLAHKYWAYSPEFQTVDSNQDIIIELDMKCENLDWGTYPRVCFYYDKPDTIENPIFGVEFHWDDPYGKNFLIADSYNHNHWANTPPQSNIWYHVKLKYHASTKKVDIYITEKSTGDSFYTKKNADFQVDPFRYIGIGYYNKPDYGNEWSPIRVDNILVATTGKIPTPLIPPLPKESPLISVEKVASSSDVAYLELIYNPRLQNYYGYEVHLSNPNLEVSVPEDHSISYIAPIKVKGQDIGGKLIIWAGTSAIDMTLGVPVASFAKTIYDTFNKDGSATNVKKVELNNFLSDEIIPCSYTESFVSGNKDIFIVQIVSKVPTKDWKISYHTTVDYKYLSDPSYEGTRKEPPKLSGTFLQSGEITINKEGVDHEWDFKNGNERVSKE